jgi:NAD(P)-dependent dehydrogenase (short-subunit alcohol dehydrogenase family)
VQEFSDKVAVVTGAASGIGLAMSELFAREGMRVVMADIEAEALRDAHQTLVTGGATALAVECDVADPQAVESLAERAVEHFGAIHLACNNAGVFVGGHLWEASLDDYRWLVEVNQFGVINGIRSFVPRMIANGEPCHLVNTASMAALTSMPYSGIYNMTKHAVLALSECLYHELSLSAPQVGVSCLCPELVATGIGRSQRNRPAELADAPHSETRVLADESIVSSTAAGAAPSVLAARVLQAVRDQQFYVLSEDGWRDTAHARLDDIRNAANPRLLPPELD